jgi:omega-amidase
MSQVKVTIIQSDLHWENQKANIEQFDKKINEIKEETNLIVLPEMFTTGFSMQATQLYETMNGKTIEWMLQKATAKNAAICGSVIIKENEQYFNRLIWANPDGTIAYYDKKHLFAYAGEHEKFTPGNQLLHVTINNIIFRCNICYDLRFPVWARQNQSPYDVLLYVANWPNKRSHAWKTLLTARAIENQCYVIGVNRVGVDGNGFEYNGNSMIVNPLGEVMFENENEAICATYTIDKNNINTIRTQIPFLKDADSFSIL